MWIGKREKLCDSMRVSQVYKEIAEKDLKSSEILFENELYNEAAYYIMQYMEKKCKGKVM